MSFEPPPPALQVKLLSETAKPPTRGSAFAAGYDLYASKEAVIPAKGKVLVDTDISIAVPVNTYGRVAPRSGLASKHSIDVGAGVIDADYRGPVKVLLFNFGEEDFKVAVHERVAQLIVERVSRIVLSATDTRYCGLHTNAMSRSIRQRSLLFRSWKLLCVAQEALDRQVDLVVPCHLLSRLLYRRSVVHRLHERMDGMHSTSIAIVPRPVADDLWNPSSTFCGIRGR